MKKVAILFDNYGPYHYARVSSLRTGYEVYAYELFASSDEYSWKARNRYGFDVHTILKSRQVNFFTRVRAILSSVDKNIDYFLVPGYYRADVLVSVLFLRLRGIRLILMSESQQVDTKRNCPREFLKSLMLCLFDGALVGGESHRSYLASLGFRKPVALGYDVVDNNFFSNFALASEETFTSPTTRVLIISRLVKKKNISFGLCCLNSAAQALGTTFKVVICGDGPLLAEIKAMIEELDALEISMPGFVQSDSIATHLRSSDVLFHPSTTEQWGLVINEAMAAGLIVIGSNRAGAVAELIADGANGFVFDPFDHESVQSAIYRYFNCSVLEKRSIRSASIATIARYNLLRFYHGVRELIDD